jgi:hypothetical protein
MQYTLDVLKTLPVVRGVVASEKAKILEQLRGAVSEEAPGLPPLVAIPQEGLPKRMVLNTLTKMHGQDTTPAHRDSSMSGTT